MRDYRGYLQRLSALYTLWGMLPTTYQLAIVAVVTTLASYLGFETGGLFYALVGGVITLAFGLMALFFLLTIIRNTTTFGKLGVGALSLGPIGADIKMGVVKEFMNVLPIVTMQNRGQRDIYYKIIRAEYSILNYVNPASEIFDEVHVVPFGFPQSVQVAAIESVKVPKYDIKPGGKSPVRGKLKLEFVYGPSKDALKYSYSYDAEIALGWTITAAPKGGVQGANVIIIAAVKRNIHGIAHG